MFDDAHEPGPNEVTCLRCGRVSFTVDEGTARGWARDMRRDFLSRRPAQIGRAPTFAITDYACLGCGGTAFRPSRAGDCPAGCTIDPVILPGG